MKSLLSSYLLSVTCNTTARVSGIIVKLILIEASITVYVCV